MDVKKYYRLDLQSEADGMRDAATDGWLEGMRDALDAGAEFLESVIEMLTRLREMAEAASDPEISPEEIEALRERYPSRRIYRSDMEKLLKKKSYGISAEDIDAFFDKEGVAW